MLKPSLLIATLGLTALFTGCGPEESVTPEASQYAVGGGTTTPPCAGTPEACGVPGASRTLTIEPCAGTPEACAEQERIRLLTTVPCAGTPEACGIPENPK